MLYSIYLQLIHLNMKRALLAGCQKINFYENRTIYLDNVRDSFNVAAWKNLTINIYKSMNEKNKKELVYDLQSGQIGNQKLYKLYCDDCILTIIKDEIDDIFENKRQQKDFIKIFDAIMKEEKVNNYCSDIIRDRLISYNEFDAQEIIKQLSDKNCTYLFSYIVIYYSIYRAQLDWEYINIRVLKALWNNQNDMKDNSEEVIEKIKNSNISHRFDKEMYENFAKYIRQETMGSLLNDLEKDNWLDVFYVAIIKICVINPKYPVYVDNIDEDIQIKFINELSKHDELMKDDSVKKMIYFLRYNYFVAWKTIPMKLNISLRSLLLTNLRYEIIVDFVNEQGYLYFNGIGEYLLIKAEKLSEKSQVPTGIKEIVKRAYIAANMSVDEFIDKLIKECFACGCEINYVQKEKMKDYLLRLL